MAAAAIRYEREHRCAGGLDVTATGRYTEEAAPAGAKGFRISVKGLNGGHSGTEIHLGRGNANKLMNKKSCRRKQPNGSKATYYQVNATYFSALGASEERLLLARAIQLFAPGKPQVHVGFVQIEPVRGIKPPDLCQRGAPKGAARSVGA